MNPANLVLQCINPSPIGATQYHGLELCQLEGRFDIELLLLGTYCSCSLPSFCPLGEADASTDTCSFSSRENLLPRPFLSGISAMPSLNEPAITPLLAPARLLRAPPGLAPRPPGVVVTYQILHWRFFGGLRSEHASRLWTAFIQYQMLYGVRRVSCWPRHSPIDATRISD